MRRVWRCVAICTVVGVLALGCDDSAAPVTDAGAAVDAADAVDAPSGTGVDAHPGTDVGMDVPGPMLELGLIGYWKFDEGQGTVAGDSSGHGNHGTVFERGTAPGGLFPGDPVHGAPKYGQGLAGAAIELDGVDDWIGVPDSTSIDSIATTGEVSVSAWVNAVDFNYPAGIVVLCQRHILGTRDAHFGLGTFKERPMGTMNLPATVAARAVGNNEAPVRRWAHMVMTRDDQVMRVYLDGAEVAESAVPRTSGGKIEHPLTSDTTPVTIGGGINEEDAIEIHKGRLDEVRLYNRALRPGEVGSLFELHRQAAIDQGITRVVELDRGLIGHWTFDGDKNGDVLDHSGHSNHGQVVKGNSADSPANAAPTMVGGVKGQGVRLNGTDEWVRVPTSESLDSSHLNEEVSISAWIKLAQAQDVLGETYVVARAGPPNGAPIFGIRLFYGGVPEGHMGFQVARAMDSVGPDTWTHLVFTFGGGSVRIHVNGEQAGFLDSPWYFDRSSILSMGAQLHGTVVQRHLDGVIDEVRIYNRGLNADEVKALWGQ